MKKIVMALSFLGSGVFANTLELDKNRLVEVIDEVDGSMIETVAKKIDKLSSESDGPIDILLNSPGGSVHVGTSIIDSMTLAKARGVTLRCTVGTLAASMAFIILSECDERYALPNAKLLFHPVSTGGRGRLQELLISMKVVEELELSIMKRLQASMKLEWKQFHLHYFSETFWTAVQLANHTGGDGEWLTIVNNITGTDKLFTIERPRPIGIFGNAPVRSPQSARVLRKLEGEGE